MGDPLFDFEELEALPRPASLSPAPSGPAAAVPPGAQRLVLGERRCFEVERSRPAALSVGVAGLGRGQLVLDLRLKAAPATGEGLFLCVSKSGEVPDMEARGFQWASTLSDSGAAGWRCRLQPHRWIYASPDATVLVAVGSTPPPRPMWCPGFAGGCTSFEPLRGMPPGPGPPAVLEASVAFEPEVSELPTAELRAAYESFHAAFAGVDGVGLSDAGKRRLRREGDSELTYGEVQLLPFWQALRERVAPRAGEVFVDLGSGTGRAVLAVALGFPELGACLGFELLPGLHAAALQALASLEAAGCAKAAVELREADFLDEPWEERADIVWVSSLCMSQRTLAAIQHRALGLRRGARVVTMTSHFGEGLAAFEPVRGAAGPRLDVEMSFGDAGVYVVRRA
mmetsp:Transcript_57570/g.184837  ORF Transcript_57570/g.184837 Transcript_57570/m.184837 type:complete len:398 (+) Transcript_57570:192-1385(+)